MQAQRQENPGRHQARAGVGPSGGTWDRGPWEGEPGLFLDVVQCSPSAQAGSGLLSAQAVLAIGQGPPD